MNDKYNVWKCLCCGNILGMVEGGQIVRIKRKDLYITVENGKVTTNCTRCGKPNTLDDSKTSAEIDLQENP